MTTHTLYDLDWRELYGERWLAENVSEADYLEYYAEHHCEWAEGNVFAMSPITDTHLLISKWLTRLLDDYLELTLLGVTRNDPFVLKLKGVKARRQPDIQVILGANQQNLTSTAMEGAADIVVEVISEGTQAIDRGVKYVEYAKGGVTEYWLIDPAIQEAVFYRLNEQKEYLQILPSQQIYTTPLLPQFYLKTNWLWQKPLPLGEDIRQWVKAMLADGKP
jgi:Uma2 family endonuclease